MKRAVVLFSVAVLVCGCAAGSKVRDPAAHDGIKFTAPGMIEIPPPRQLLSSPEASGAALAAVPEKQLIVLRVEMTLAVRDRDGTAGRISMITRECDGISTVISSDHLDMLIPEERADSVIAVFEKLGRVIYRKYSWLDITAAYHDRKSERENMRATRDRLQQLLATSQTAQDVLGLEKELERLDRQIAQYDRQEQSDNRGLRFVRISLRLRLWNGYKPGPVGYLFYKLFQGASWLIAHR